LFKIVLMKTFYAVLQGAQASGVKSIAIPPISLGIFSIPEKLVFRAMIVATLCWAATDGKRGCLKKIQFISNQKRVGNESTARDIATWLEEALDTRSFDKANARAASVERESDFATAQAQWYFEVYNHELSSDRTTVKMHGKWWQKFEPDQCGKIDDTYLDMKSTDPGSHTGATANMVDFSGEKRVVDVKEGGIVNIVQTGNRYSIVFDEAAGFENAPSMLSNLKKAFGYTSSRAMYQRARIAAPTAAMSGRYTSIICVRTRASSSPDACRSRSRATTTRSFSISAWAASRASLACRAGADCSSQPDPVLGGL
jgi:hypothetical protein